MVDTPDPHGDDEIPEEMRDPKEQVVREQQERGEYLEAHQGQLKGAWEDTIEDMHGLADDWRDEGYDVTEIVAVDAGPIGRDFEDDEGEYGMEFVIADDDAEEFEAAFEAADYPQYDVYRGEVQADAFLVVELVDPDAERVILLAGAYHLKDTMMAAYAARDEEKTYTFVRTLDGTRYGAFEHDGYRKFFPRADDLPDDPMELEFR